MCDCVRDIEAKLVENVIKKQYPEGKSPVATLAGQALRIPKDGSESYWVGTTPINASVMLPARKGSTLMKVKKIKLNMYFSYCPYCGVKYAS